MAQGSLNPEQLFIMNYHKLAIKLAKTVQGRYRVSAIVLDKRDRVLSTGTNSYWKSHPMQKKYSIKTGNDMKIFLHAEIAALLKAKIGEAYKIYVCRIDKEGNTVLAKPCPTCELLIKEHGIKIVEYTV